MPICHRIFTEERRLVIHSIGHAIPVCQIIFSFLNNRGKKVLCGRGAVCICCNGISIPKLDIQKALEAVERLGERGFLLMELILQVQFTESGLEVDLRGNVLEWHLGSPPGSATDVHGRVTCSSRRQ